MREQGRAAVRDVVGRAPAVGALVGDVEYFKNNYVPTEYKEELAKAFAQTVIREDNARQAACAREEGGARE